MNEKMARLGKTLDNSTYTVAPCGSGMVEEGGFIDIKKQDKTYDIENRYDYGAGEMHTSTFYNIRPGRFFEFYKKETLHNTSRDTTSGPALAAIERTGKLQCAIDNSIYDEALRGGYRYVINLHGSIYQNQCPRCKKKYPIEYITGARRIPICRDYNVPIRPMISLIREMIDSQNMTGITEKITKTDTLLLLKTTLASEVFCQYIQCFAERNMIIIHKQERYLDKDADLVMLDHPTSVLPQLGYGEKETEE